jgi:hypothetical protein
VADETFLCPLTQLEEQHLTNHVELARIKRCWI